MTCPKHPFDSEAAARSFAALRGSNVAYACLECSKWHVSKRQPCRGCGLPVILVFGNRPIDVATGRHHNLRDCHRSGTAA